MRSGVHGVIQGLGRIVLVCAALGCLGAAPWDSIGPSISKVRLGGDDAQTRIVVELNRTTRGVLVDTKDPQRITLRLEQLEVPQGLAGAGGGLVRRWTVERSGGDALVELALQRPAVVARRFLLAPNEWAPNYRYVIDLAANGPAPAPSLPAEGGLAERLTQVAPLPAHPHKVIVIDAGHGGKDPGALGDRDAHEKDATLAAAKALKRRLERDGRYVVVLTRSRDVFVPLEDRVQIARRADADLFISLHADAGADPGVRGATVYTLSDKGSDRVARKVISRNDWFLNVDLPSHDKAVNQILLDLTQRATKNQSTSFADLLVNHVSGQTVMLQHSHRDAGYVVLLAPDVPAVLLEMGFITNPDDAETLRDPLQRERLMASVGDAIDDYFDQERRYAAR
jgi:N-acetylmuramoyl-L-alanine amidase